MLGIVKIVIRDCQVSLVIVKIEARDCQNCSNGLSKLSLELSILLPGIVEIVIRDCKNCCGQFEGKSCAVQHVPADSMPKLISWGTGVPFNPATRRDL